MSLRVTPLKGCPGVIDEIFGDASSVLLWRETKHEYRMTIDGQRFVFVTSERRGPGIQVVRAYNSLGTVAVTEHNETGGTVRIFPLAGQPGIVDRVEAEHIGGVHIERMSDAEYWGHFGSENFGFQTAGRRTSPTIHLIDG